MSSDVRSASCAPPAGAGVFVPLARPILTTAATAAAACTPAMPLNGCHQATFKPTGPSAVEFRGSLRVDGGAGTATISGDLYAVAPTLGQPLAHVVPVYPRAAYHSYLRVTGAAGKQGGTGLPCVLVLTAEEYVYEQPPSGSFNGTFPGTPTRTVTIELAPQPATVTGHPIFTGTLNAGGVVQGTFSIRWATASFRSALLVVHTLTGAASPPFAVPDQAGTGIEDFSSVYETAGWNLTALPDTTALPVPAGVNPTDCWSDADLFDLLGSVLTPATALDVEWRFHLLVVPGKLGCGRGEMFDASGSSSPDVAPRQGAVSYSDDGYPSSDPVNYGAAADKKQRDVPRAFLRSACHEVGHGFNQQHQDLTELGEPGEDNSIMTPTPGVADALNKSGGTFPNDVNLGFNAHVRHHMIHFPDPAVRPGGMDFGTGHDTFVPQSDAGRFVSPAGLELRLTTGSNRVKLGQPLPVSWQLSNKGAQPVRVPSDLSPRARHARIWVTNPPHPPRTVPPFVIRTDAVVMRELAPSASLEGRTDLFWGPQGFAFERPGRHRIHVRVAWKSGGVLYGVQADAEVWVDYPSSEADNEVAAQLLHREVGMAVALGGVASKLGEGAKRIEQVLSRHAQHPSSAHLKGLAGPRK